MKAALTVAAHLFGTPGSGLGIIAALIALAGILTTELTR